LYVDAIWSYGHKIEIKAYLALTATWRSGAIRYTGWPNKNSTL